MPRHALATRRSFFAPIVQSGLVIHPDSIITMIPILSKKLLKKFRKVLKIRTS